MVAQQQTEKSVFLAAVEIASDAERAAFVAQACADDLQLRAEVNALLQAHAKPQPLLDAASATGPTLDQPIAEAPGTVIGAYKLLEQIGEGGFGVVFMAEQTQPVRRKVALKILKPGMDTRQVVARFEAERQALAIMDHPNIARVFDGGTTPTGRPYFVMELVKGMPITEFCDQNQLTPRQRLELFIPVCQAVQHAHQKGIIHRDLKPSNVLISRHDTTPIVKVIDFGVAKALGQELTDKTLFTGIAQMIGTPLYMSPEQAGMSDLDVDTRSDIYSLGVLLYELLTGTTPLSRERLKGAPYDEIRRLISEEEPPKPSTRLSESKDTLSSISAQRHTEPAKLMKLMRGELDWIVMKALEKDRSRRYETANGFAMDVQRYLADEPVLACPPSVGYRLRKLVRRNRGAVLAAALVTVALVGGFVGTTWGMIHARWAQQAETERAEAESRQRQRADAAEGAARQREAEARAIAELAVRISEFLENDVLGQAGSAAQADRRFRPDPDLTVREALDRAACRIEGKFSDQPLVEASLRKSVGDAYRNLGQFEKALDHLRLSVDLYHRRLGPEAEMTLDALHRLAFAYREARMTAEAIKTFELVRAGQMKIFPADDRRLLTTVDNLAAAYRDARRVQDARGLFEVVREAKVRTLGPDDPSTLATLHNLAVMDLEAGKTTEAIVQFEQIRAAKLKVLGPDHPDLLPTLQNLAAAYWMMKHLDKSIPQFEELVKLARRILGDTHPMTLGNVANLGVNYRDAGRLADAIPLLEQVYRHPRKYESLRWVGPELLLAYARAGKPVQATDLAREYVAAARIAFPPESPQLADALAISGSALVELNSGAEAEPYLRECLAIREKNNPDDWRTAYTRSMLGGALLGQKKHAEAETLLLRAYVGMKQHKTNIATNFRDGFAHAIERLVQLYEAWGKEDEAVKWRNELEARRAARVPGESKQK